MKGKTRNRRILSIFLVLMMVMGTAGIQVDNIAKAYYETDLKDGLLDYGDVPYLGYENYDGNNGSNYGNNGPDDGNNGPNYGNNNGKYNNGCNEGDYYNNNNNDNNNNNNDDYGDNNYYGYKCEYDECDYCDYYTQCEYCKAAAALGVIEIAPFSSNITQHATVTDWRFYDEISGNQWDINYPVGGIEFWRQARFWFSWEVNMPVGTFIQAQDLIRFYRPSPVTTGGFRMINSAWVDFFDGNNNLLGQTRIQGDHIEIRFSDYAIGEQNISGTFSTGYTVEAHVALGGPQDVIFGSVTRTFSFVQRASNRTNSTRAISNISTSGSRMTYIIHSNTIGLRELAGNPNSGFHGEPIGANFTIRDNFTIINDLIPGSRMSAVSFNVPITMPANTELPNLIYTSGTTTISRSITSFVTRVWPLEGESRSDFITRVQNSPFQWGVWPAPLQGQSAASVSFTVDQTVVAYFGTLGVDGPRVSELPPGGFSANAQAVINNGYFPDEMYDDLVAWFTAMFGDGNAINGRLPTVRMSVALDFPTVLTPTATGPINATVTYAGQTSNPNLTNAGGTLQPLGAGAQLAQPDRARVFLIDTDLPQASWFLDGADFQLQQLVGTEWYDVVGRVYTTGMGLNSSAGSFETGILPAGVTLRFRQLTGPAPPRSQLYPLFWFLSPQWSGAPENAVISQAFTSGGTAQSRTMTIINLIGGFDVNYQFVSYPVGQTLPEAVTDLLPATRPNIAIGTVVNPTAVSTTSVAVTTGTAGTWDFQGFTPASHTITNQNVVFVGAWSFTPAGGQGGGNQNPNLQSLKFSDVPEGATVREGDTVTYTIRVTNTGNAAINNVVISDTIPYGMTLVPGSAVTYVGTTVSNITPVITNNNRTLTWTIPSMATGQAQGVSVSFKVTVDSMPGNVFERTFTNTATVNGDNTNTVVIEAERLIKHPDRMQVHIGEEINWTLRNIGNPTGETVNGFGIVDMPGRGLNFRSASIPALTGGAGITYDIRYRVYGDVTWHTAHLGVPADAPFTFSLPQDGLTFYTEIWFYFGTVPAGFARGENDRIVLTFVVGPGAPNNQLINRFFLSYNDEDEEGENPDRPTSLPPGNGVGSGDGESGENDPSVTIEDSATPLTGWEWDYEQSMWIPSQGVPLTDIPQTGVTGSGIELLVLSLLAMFVLGRRRSPRAKYSTDENGKSSF